MEFVTRLADPGHNYPLPVQGPAVWQRSPDDHEVWQTIIELPGIPAGHIVVPSFSHLHDDAGTYQFELRTQDQAYLLHPVPVAAHETQPKPTRDSKGDGVTCHIDCWHTHNSVRAAVVVLNVLCPQEPTHYLLTVSIRAIELPSDKLADLLRDVRDNPPAAIKLQVPRVISQMTAATEIRSRICSPTALTMALSCYQMPQDWPGADWQAAIAACYDPQTKAYGAWPLAIRHAAQLGVLGAVEVVDDWRWIRSVLSRGFPVVCSIRFAKGELHNAPLEQTGGHLVVLYGLEQENVHVLDPAASTDAQVQRSYRAEEFARAWMQRRGAVYIFGTSVRAESAQETTD